MRAVGVVGFKNSGKTTVAVELAEALVDRGLKVAAIKFSHHPLDKKGTDTWKLTQACGQAVGLTLESGAFFWNGVRYLDQIIPLLDADFLVIEGGKSTKRWPRIAILRDLSEEEELVDDLVIATTGDVASGKVRHISDVGALADLAMSRGFLLPGLDCGGCGISDCAALASLIVAGKAAPEDCISQTGELTIEINGAPIAMNPFVARMMRATLTGMLSELKGFSPGEVTITFGAGQ
jgi:molybdopterin-guanine dinucleotide biosynthesis protein B